MYHSLVIFFKCYSCIPMSELSYREFALQTYFTFFCEEIVYSGPCQSQRYCAATWLGRFSKDPVTEKRNGRTALQQNTGDNDSVHEDETCHLQDVNPCSCLQAKVRKLSNHCNMLQKPSEEYLIRNRCPYWVCHPGLTKWITWVSSRQLKYSGISIRKYVCSINS